MKNVVFDASSIITLAMNNLLWVLEIMKRRMDGRFYISKSVKREIVDKPLEINRYRLEGLQILDLLGRGILEVYEGGADGKRLVDLGNKIYKIEGRYLNFLHLGEMDTLAIGKELNAVVVIDERSARVLSEHPKGFEEFLRRKFKKNIQVDNKNLKDFGKLVEGVKIIRSTELMTVAYELGFLDRYITKDEERFTNKDLKKELLDGLLWGLRFKGCAISNREINELMQEEGY